MAIEKIRYDGKRTLVVGGASGMGRATAAILRELGAWVAVMDVQAVVDPVDQTISVDLRRQESIDAALAQLDGPIHGLFSCAGVADGTPGLMDINFLGQRYIVEQLVADGRMSEGSAIAVIASIGGFGWEKNFKLVNDFLDTTSIAEGDLWVQNHPESDNYGFSKQAVNGYCARQAATLRAKQIRINSIAPGPTMTPLMAANDVWRGFEAGFNAAMNKPGSTPEEQAWPLVFLNSDAASYISGTVLTIDAGFVGGGITRTIEGPLVDAVLGPWLDPT